MDKIIKVVTAVMMDNGVTVTRTIAVGESGLAYVLHGEQSGKPHWIALPPLPAAK